MVWFPFIRPSMRTRPSVNVFPFTRLVHTFDPILLKLAQTVCIIVRINLIENENKKHLQKRS